MGPAAPSQSQSEPLTIRVATPLDVDALTELTIVAFPDDPQFSWKYCKAQEYPEVHYRGTRAMWTGLLSSTQTYTTILACLPSGRPIAWACFLTLPVYNTLHGTALPRVFTLPGLEELSRRDADPERLAAFAHATYTGWFRFFRSFGPRNIYITNLSTHPDYRRRGAARLLVQWGIDLARRHGMTITVFGSPMGKYLYAACGFTTLGLQPYGQELGADKDRCIVAMVLPFKEDSALRRDSIDARGSADGSL